MTLSSVDPETGEVLAPPTFTWDAGVHPAADLFPMLGPVEFHKLCEDIAEHGLHEPVWIDTEGRLLDGRNRLAACQRGAAEVVTRTYEGDDPTRFVISLNVHRRHLTASQLAAIAVESLPLFEEEAKVRQRESGPASVAKRQGTVVADRPQPSCSAPKARDEAAAAVGVGGRTVGKAKRVAEEDPDLFERVKTGEVTVDAADRELTERKERDRREAVDDAWQEVVTEDPEIQAGLRRQAALRAVSALLKKFDEVKAVHPHDLSGDDLRDLQRMVTQLESFIGQAKAQRRQLRAISGGAS